MCTNRRGIIGIQEILMSNINGPANQLFLQYSKVIHTDFSYQVT